MPRWHEETLELQRSGKLQVLGIIQEQHPNRCRLFLQWKGMEWPVLVDSLNILGVTGVPLAFLIDEHGVIRSRKPDDAVLSRFLSSTFPKPSEVPPPPPPLDPVALSAKVAPGAAGEKDSSLWMALGDALFLRGREADLGACADAYGKAAAPGGPPDARFRLGVALRRRYESALRQDGDFQKALDAWGKALELRPNQYIWRRRIQQYGPRLEKPYAYYDWVQEAREVIRKRGEEPVPLATEPRGTELAGPARAFRAREGELKEPDPKGRVRRDRKRLILAETAVAPAVVGRGKTARVHLILRPDARQEAHWNNAAENLRIWIQPPGGVEVDRRQLSVPNPETEVSTETREVELEVRIPDGAKAVILLGPKPGVLTIPAYALYYVCEGKEGTCWFLRQDLEIELRVK